MKRSIVGSLTAAVLLATAACGDSEDSSSDSSAGGKDTIDIGAISIADTAPVQIAQKKGLFEKHDIKANVSSVQGGAASVTGVVSGQFDFAFANTTSLLTGREQGLPLKVVANGVNSTGKQGEDFSAVMVKKDSSIKDASGLEGKKVAVNNLKNIGDTTVRASVRKANGDPDKVNFVEMPFPDMPAALDKGRVDAAWVVEPFVSAIKGQGGRAVAWNFADAADNLTVAMYFTTEQFAQENPDLVKRFTATMKEALAYCDSHPDEVRGMLGDYTKIPAEAIPNITLPKWPEEINEESVATIGELAKGDGVLKEDADVEALLP